MFITIVSNVVTLMTPVAGFAEAFYAALIHLYGISHSSSWNQLNSGIPEFYLLLDSSTIPLRVHGIMYLCRRYDNGILTWHPRLTFGQLYYHMTKLLKLLDAAAHGLFAWLGQAKNLWTASSQQMRAVAMQNKNPLTESFVPVGGARISAAQARGSFS